ncbi:MAG TPA: DUF2188 domain-containing protein [Longimicrobium sp.]|nr:DUF2188 domain-containing protein [Longimicrobium sp.]
MARNIYDVSPDGDKWKVKKRGAATAAGTFDKKQDAVDYGVALARANQPSQLVIRRKDGTIEEERTYGDDPYPPAG